MEFLLIACSVMLFLYITLESYYIFSVKRRYEILLYKIFDKAIKDNEDCKSGVKYILYNLPENLVGRKFRNKIIDIAGGNTDTNEEL